MPPDTAPNQTAARTDAPTGQGEPDGSQRLRPRSRALSLPGPLGTVYRGYRRVSAAERAGFGILSSFAVTIGASRVINYVRERRRSAPRLRSWGRHAYHAPGREQLRIHHFVPGIGLALLSGAAAILTRDDEREFWFSLPFGIGAGLTFDEIAVLTELDNPYWESEKFSIVQAAIASLGAVGLTGRFYSRGTRTND